jgi:tetraacyldisaccharide 4'-kinase
MINLFDSSIIQIFPNYIKSTTFTINHSPFTIKFMPLSRLYGAIVNARNSLYKSGVFKSFSLGVPTISVGNITVGGTGKTPLVAFVAEILAEEGEKVCILTRGYGRENSRKRVLVSDGENILVNAKQAGDEPFELAQKLLGKALVVADADRVSAGIWAREKFGITVFVLDDAFQHLKVKRDLNVVTIDATNPFGNGKILPSGILREPLQNLKRADLIVITRANLTNEILNLKSQISKYNSSCPIIISENKVSNLIELEDFDAKTNKTMNSEQLTTNNSFAFCALGNPENFFEQLRRENFNLVSTERFPDHHFYTQKDIEKLEQKAKHLHAEIFLTTAKDAVKLKDLKFNLLCYVVENRLIFDDEKKLREIIRAVFFRKSETKN